MRTFASVEALAQHLREAHGGENPVAEAVDRWVRGVDSCTYCEPEVSP